MKKLNPSLLALTFALIALHGARAQTAFQGPYVQVESGYQYNRIASSSPSISTPAGVAEGTPTGATHANGALLSVNGGYSFKLAPRWRLISGVEHQFIDNSTHSVISNFGGPRGYGQVPYYFQVSDETNFFLAPAYLISDRKLVFVKAGYSFEAVSLNAVDFRAKTSNGYVVGVGYKQMVTHRFYVTTEAHYSQYGKVSPPGVYGTGATLIGTTGNLGALNLIVGLGFKIRK